MKASVTIQQTKKGESFTYDTPSLLNQTHNLSYNIILKLIIPILQPFGNIFPIFHKALFLLFLVQITIEKYLPSIFITKIHIPTSFESSDKNKGDLEVGNPHFLLYIKKRPIVLRL